MLLLPPERRRLILIYLCLTSYKLQRQPIISATITSLGKEVLVLFTRLRVQLEQNMVAQANHKLQHGGGEESEADFFVGLRRGSVSWHSWPNCVCFDCMLSDIVACAKLEQMEEYF